MTSYRQKTKAADQAGTSAGIGVHPSRSAMYPACVPTPPFHVTARRGLPLSRYYAIATRTAVQASRAMCHGAVFPVFPPVPYPGEAVAPGNGSSTSVGHSPARCYPDAVPLRFRGGDRGERSSTTTTSYSKEVTVTIVRDSACYSGHVIGNKVAQK